jgi:cobalt-zinc-cadmium efflux system outer membrane protein
MRSICLGPLLAAASLGVLSGCQHVPPQPLDLTAIQAEQAGRTLDVAPVRAFAEALAVGSDPPEVFNAEDGLSLREGQAVALWYNLDLRVARLRAEGAQAMARASGRWPDPELGFETGQKSVDEAGHGFLHEAGGVTRSWISMGSISITIPLSGRLRAERALHRTEYDRALLQAAEAEAQTLDAVRRAWAVWSAAHARAALVADHLAVVGQVAETAEALAQAGELPATSARLLTIERLRHAAAQELARATEAEARAALLHTLGLLPDAPVELVPGFDTTVPTAAIDIAEHPRVAVLRAAYQAAEDRLRVALRKQYPDLRVSPTYTNEDDETAIVAGLGFPVPVWNANRLGIAEAVSAREVARAEVEAACQALAVEMAQARAAAEGSQAQRARLLETVAPALDTQMAEALALLRAGEIDVVLLHEALRQSLDIKQALLDAAYTEALAAARLTAATANPLHGLAPLTETKE